MLQMFLNASIYWNFIIYLTYANFNQKFSFGDFFSIQSYYFSILSVSLKITSNTLTSWSPFSYTLSESGLPISETELLFRIDSVTNRYNCVEIVKSCFRNLCFPLYCPMLSGYCNFCNDHSCSCK